MLSVFLLHFTIKELFKKKKKVKEGEESVIWSMILGGLAACTVDRGRGSGCKFEIANEMYSVQFGRWK